MVGRVVRFSCGECHKEYLTYEKARRCEGDHLVDKAVDELRDEFAAIFAAVRAKGEAA